eukprot:NODE_2674_length_757_cov_241.132768_g1874_i0.p1 GENE.NODE_2674_length_757_cov_241.132768_g1874_i0~~NODE_2674_length_757_cov_241.132768_g1874_i0.p1  ORF type:complete len:189 (-),score=55.78 NODE_2674_length_757_cov_241.132768_g1874_i0:115-681(-)
MATITIGSDTWRLPKAGKFPGRATFGPHTVFADAETRVLYPMDNDGLIAVESGRAYQLHVLDLEKIKAKAAKGSKPKGSMSGYNLFMKTFYAQQKAAGQRARMADVHQAWTKLSEDQRQGYNDQAKGTVKPEAEDHEDEGEDDEEIIDEPVKAAHPPKNSRKHPQPAPAASAASAASAKRKKTAAAKQ